jgi:ParB family chromosome partitioning protein
MKIPIESIKVNEGRRPVDFTKVKELAESIKEVGLINPITVRPEGAEYLLIAGMHRLEAYKLLGINNIESNIIFKTDLEIELIEIDENLIRNELHYSERADLLLRRKEIYEELYPETKREATLKQNRNEIISERTKPSFVKDTAEKTGQSERTVEMEIQIAKNLDSEEKRIIKDQDINKTEAIKLARMDPEERKPVVELFSKGEVRKVEEAKQILDPIDEEYKKISKEIDKTHDNYKLVANLLNAPKYLNITEQHIEDYLSYTDEYFQDRFLSNCDRMIDKLKEIKGYYSNLNQIRRVK